MNNEVYSQLKIKAERALKENFGSGGFSYLEKGMEYSLFAGGKRLRPVIMLYLCEKLGVDGEKAGAFAAAVEMIHTYSLIHDDLPCMDDDDYRRGKLTNHKVFGIGNGVLNGDALLNLSMETVLRVIESKSDIAAARYLFASSGRRGMCSGQSADLYYEGKAVGTDVLKYIDKNKTGALLRACFAIPAVLAGVDANKLEIAGDKFGELFQLTDDYLDVFGEQNKVGKTLGKDEKRGKATAVAILGKEGALAKIAQLEGEAIAVLEDIGDLSFLIELVKHTAKREY